MNSQIPLYSIEAEMSALGSMMFATKAAQEVTELLEPEDFFRPAHKTIFESISKLVRARKEVDIVTLRTDLTTRGEMSNCGGIDYLLEIAQYVPSAANAKHYAGIVLEKSHLRKLDAYAREILDLVHGDLELDDKQSRAEELISLSRKKQGAMSFVPVASIMKELIGDVDQMIETGECRYGISTGFKEIDSIITGLVPGEMVIIAGRPSMAKTSLVAQIGLNVATHGYPVAMWSAEMTAKKIAERLVSVGAELTNEVFRKPIDSEKTYERLGDAMEYISGLPFYISDETPSIDRMFAQARDFQRENGGGHCLFIVDYAQLIAEKKKGETTNDAVTRVSKTLLRIAKDLKCTMIALSQLSRDCEKRDNKRPTLSDLRDSGSLEQDAHLVIGLYRQEYYDAKSDHRPEAEVHEAEVIVLKSRNGPLGTATLAFQPKYTRFRSIKA